MVQLPPLRLLVVSVIICIGGPFHLGYQSIVTNPSQKAFTAFVNASHYQHYNYELSKSALQATWSATVALLSAGAAVGCLLIRYVSEKYGRKGGLYYAVGLNIVGTVLVILSYHVFSYELFMAARVVTGCATSLSIGLASMLLNESSPKSCRGFISMLSFEATTLGTVIASVVAMTTILGTETRWWYLYLMEIGLFVPLLAMLPFIPESPGFLAQNDDEAAARRAILFYHNCQIGAVDAVITEIKENLKIRAKSMSLKATMRDSYCRKGVIVGIVVSAVMTFSGSSTVNAFAVALFANCGMSQQEAAYGNIAIMVITLIFSTAATFVVDKYGRRPLILISTFGLTVLNIVVFALMLSFEKTQLRWIGYFLIVVICLTKFFFAIGIGPLCFFIAAEMVGQAARGVSQACATMAQMLSRTVTISVWLPLSLAVGQSFAYLILFVAPLAFSDVYLYFNLPETKNRNHKEVIEAMDNLPSFSKCIHRRNVNTRVADSTMPQKDDLNVACHNVPSFISLLCPATDIGSGKENIEKI